MSAPLPPVFVQHVRKRFRRGERHDSLRDLIPAVARRLRGHGPRPDELREGDFWALDDVSFTVRPGEALGVIGPNGAGKSTLLKLLTKILRPTSGECRVRGRMGALIEIAAGFHPDLTGRENIFLQGAMIGMRRAEIASLLDEIVDFAGIGPFLDTPVKRYSSGMNARLGFSIAAHLRPDVLVIDEVLAVGDLLFQEKCLDRMKAFKRQGVAIVFVSHNMQAVSTLCDRGLFLKSRVRADGPAHEVIAAFLREMGTQHTAAVGEEVEILGARLTDPAGAPVMGTEPNVPLRLTVDYLVHRPLEDVHFGFAVRRATDALVAYDGGVQGIDIGMPSIPAGARFTLNFDFRAHLARGQYQLECAVRRNVTQEDLAVLSPAAVLRVDETWTWQGVADLELACTR